MTASGFAATDVLADDYEGGPDSVSRATETPEELQPFAELGLKDDEYARIRDILGRRPTASELAMALPPERVTMSRMMLSP